MRGPERRKRDNMTDIISIDRSTIIHATAHVDGIAIGIQAESLEHMAEIMADLIGPDRERGYHAKVNVEGIGSQWFGFTGTKTYWEIL